VKDNRSEIEYIEFLRKNISNALFVANPDCHVFYWNTEQQIWILQTLYQELGIKNKRVCLWIKNGQNPTPQVAFSKCFEPCIYGVIGKPYLSKKEQGLNEVLNKEITTGNNLIEEVSNIWAVKRLPSNKYEHATSKPSELYEKAILRCSKPGDIIYDSFAGSGPLLIACEQLKRKAYLVEQQPVFCQLIVNRFKALTGIKSKIIS
jgi:DNA modification methylase